MQQISSALSANILRTFYSKVKVAVAIMWRTIIANILRTSSYQWSEDFYKSQSLLNSNKQNLSILHWPQQATPFENNEKSKEQKNTWEEITYSNKTSQHIVIFASWQLWQPFYWRVLRGDNFESISPVKEIRSLDWELYELKFLRWTLRQYIKS